MGNMAIGSGTIGAGQEMQISGLSSVLNAQTNAYVNSNDSFLGDVGGILGGAASVYTAFGGSDRSIKQDIEKVGVDNRTGLTLYEFSYVDAPSTRYVGVMADEVETIYPEAVVQYEHFKGVNYDMLGLELKEVA
jgi:hypothetical protein